ncbi:hypothetical protein [Candidatus Mycoplasma haematohominis]|uniref:Uncharacterized protein n=1 Tax=Candidatus Mycoplasma haematohominis TaxID=1494318 RepID=A0A478FR23_9MOLU|nr:hypothetical protein [Candidatus Mycoplasma haemohominis]GCE63862.1 hypothetical protein MHSWG343_08690 [Candidatus Mycoplasma haemohominis]
MRNSKTVLFTICGLLGVNFGGYYVYGEIKARNNTTPLKTEVGLDELRHKKEETEEELRRAVRQIEEEYDYKFRYEWRQKYFSGCNRLMDVDGCIDDYVYKLEPKKFEWVPREYRKKYGRSIFCEDERHELAPHPSRKYHVFTIVCEKWVFSEYDY